MGDLGSIPGLGRCPGEGKSYPLQYCGLENSMDGIVHGVAKSQTRLNDFHLLSDLMQKDPLIFNEKHKLQHPGGKMESLVSTRQLLAFLEAGLGCYL